MLFAHSLFAGHFSDRDLRFLKIAMMVVSASRIDPAMVMTLPKPLVSNWSRSHSWIMKLRQERLSRGMVT